MLISVRRLARRFTDAMRAHPFRADLLLSLVFTMFSFIGAQLTNDVSPPPERVDLTWWRYAILSLVTIPYALHRLRPILALSVLSAAFLFLTFESEHLDLSVGVLILWLVLHAVGAYGGRWRNWARTACVATVLGVTVYEVVHQGVFSQRNPVRVLLITLASTVGYMIAAWLLGDFSRERRETTELLAHRASELERSQAENARRAVLDDRVRISRELHDVVAHHVSVMGVQAGAARRVMAKNPAQAVDALSAIESSSRRAVGEMQRLIGFLRQEGDVDGLAPQPGLDQLDRLLDDATTPQLLVEVRRSGDVIELPPAVDLSAYRIVQEALTNVRKHARAASHVCVALNYHPDALEIEVLDNGIVPARQARRPGMHVPETSGPDNDVGNGIRGMRERAALLGGSLLATPAQGGGFVVRSHLPLHAPSVASVSTLRAEHEIGAMRVSATL